MLFFLRTCALAPVALAIALAGCASDQVYEADGGPLGPPRLTAELVVESERSLALLFEERARVELRYVELDGTPIPDSPVAFALLGHANDSSLSAFEAFTDADGRVAVELRAGTAISTFRVQASADRAASVDIDASVSNQGFGSLLVAVRWHGGREVVRRHVSLYADAACEDDNGLEMDAPDRTTSLEPAAASHEFRALPAGQVYAVVGRGLSETGVELARGCVDGVVASAETATEVEVTLELLPLIAVGDYGVEADLGISDSATTIASTVESAMSAAITAAGGDGALFLDAAERVLGEGGEVAAARALATARDDGALDAALDERLRSRRVGASAAASALGELLGSQTHLVVGGVLTLDGEAAWSDIAISTHPESSSAAWLALDLGAFELVPVLTLDAVIDTANRELQFERISLELPLGTVAAATLSAVREGRRPPYSIAAIESRLGCDELRGFVVEHTALASSCDDTCVADVCARVVDELLDAAASTEGTLNEHRSQLELSGQVALVDEDGDRRVTRLSSGRLTGVWSAPGGDNAETIAGSFSGTRMIE